MDPQHKSVSVIIPVYNDPSGISQTLNSLVDHMYSPAEFLVIDNGSTDNTRTAIQDYTKNHDNIHLLVEDDIQGSYAARNKGIQQADSAILAFLDADETVDEDWLKTAIETMNEQGVDYLGCNVELTLPEDTLVGRYDAYSGFPVKRYLDTEHYAPTCALLVRHKVFENIGTFDSRLISGGDRDFGERAHKAGYEQGYAENATVYHPARTSLSELVSKNFRVGRGFCQMQRYYPERYGKPGTPPSPNGPSGGSDEDEPDSLITKLAFTFLSFAMLACRGMGYYYEYFVGDKRNDIPAPTS